MGEEFVTSRAQLSRLDFTAHCKAYVTYATNDKYFKNLLFFLNPPRGFGTKI
jgi:hypothetical protein